MPPPLNLRSRGTSADDASSLWTSSSGLLFFFVSTRAKAMGIVKEGRGLRCLEVENRERERERENLAKQKKTHPESPTTIASGSTPSCTTSHAPLAARSRASSSLSARRAETWEERTTRRGGREEEGGSICLIGFRRFPSCRRNGFWLRISSPGSVFLASPPLKLPSKPKQWLPPSLLPPLRPRATARLRLRPLVLPPLLPTELPRRRPPLPQPERPLPRLLLRPQPPLPRPPLRRTRRSTSATSSATSPRRSSSRSSLRYVCGYWGYGEIERASGARVRDESSRGEARRHHRKPR